ncbi:hypothetical protein KQX54_003745 [Cotesia glomerata]|uniref:Uncharacterized protein n=1 Tax=Cotesia glomerata TaxID=32391 RepID=A0AAV7I6S3_COTGL|nr:hypothetical protein KQX54_003745 [Cotesia glomerata]
MLTEVNSLTEIERCLVCYIMMSPGASNCSWTSCREGCTKELYDCTQIRVNYKLPVNETQLDGTDREGRAGGGVEGDEAGYKSRYERSPRDYNNYIEDFDDEFDEDDIDNRLPKPFPTGLMGNDSEWYFTGAKLFPNVKGCGYPPILNCSIFYKQYTKIGHNFSCYYSKIDPGIVLSDLDMWQVSIKYYIT